LQLLDQNITKMGWCFFENFISIPYSSSVIHSLVLSLGVLVGFGGIHVCFSLLRWLKRRKSSQLPWTSALNLHRAAGYISGGMLIFAHAPITRIFPVFLNFEAPIIQFVHQSIVDKPFVMYPYYFIFSSTALYHLLYGGLSSVRILSKGNVIHF
jgi:hypothetical protein